jgi:hypothetical protein
VAVAVAGEAFFHLIREGYAVQRRQLQVPSLVWVVHMASLPAAAGRPVNVPTAKVIVDHPSCGLDTSARRWCGSVGTVIRK